ncbi:MULTISPECIES: helix-turn-helix transcriptional regulator [unclassified Endozoicomonas]|uniref:helix-turn-helix transcriptional regulator n=1 Tax=unclassified Endozoicomonas TaxID=2644528 RepID=UPI003BB4F81B
MAKKVFEQDAIKRGFTPEQASNYTGFSKSLIDHYRTDGQVNDISGPAFIKIGRKVIYLKESLDEWMDSFTQVRSLAELTLNEPDDING